MPGGRLYQGARSLTTAPDWLPATSPGHPALLLFYQLSQQLSNCLFRIQVFRRR